MKIIKAQLRNLIKEELEAIMEQEGEYYDLMDNIDIIDAKLAAILKPKGLKDYYEISRSPDDYGDSPAGMAKKRFLTTGIELANSLRKGPELAVLIEKLVEELRKEVTADEDAGYYGSDY
jgi:hypothetical protein